MIERFVKRDNEVARTIEQYNDTRLSYIEKTIEFFVWLPEYEVWGMGGTQIWFGRRCAARASNFSHFSGGEHPQILKILNGKHPKF